MVWVNRRNLPETKSTRSLLALPERVFYDDGYDQRPLKLSAAEFEMDRFLTRAPLKSGNPTFQASEFVISHGHALTRLGGKPKPAIR
jgi:hypothetical protein